jgi:hypothetical protein
MTSKLQTHLLGPFMLLSSMSAWSAEVGKRNVDGIQDNSFLVEEAYNQEPGVVQHIFTAFYNVNQQNGADDKEWALSFTQEWPLFTQKHQLSYTIPYYFAREDRRSANGLGDVLINYRYQALFDEESLLALAPRFSLVLPTGDDDDGFGDDTLGYQVNLPFSTAIGQYWFLHLNVGATYLPDAGGHPDRDLIHYNIGASGIYAVAPTVHLMLEWLGNWNHEADDHEPREREFESLISPGLRKAFDFINDRQLVVGLAAPIGLTGSAPDYGVFLYVSFEHFFSRNN